MPHHPAGSCSVCSHDQREAIDSTLVEKTVPLRALAGQFGLSKTSLLRHKQYHLQNELIAKAAKDAAESEESAAIDFEIAKLKKAERRADRKHDLKVRLQISREIRTWLLAKSKLKAKSGLTGNERDQKPASKVEALELAKTIIEAELSSPGRDDVIAWIHAVLERVVATQSATSAAVTTHEAALSV